MLFPCLHGLIRIVLIQKSRSTDQIGRSDSIPFGTRSVTHATTQSVLILLSLHSRTCWPEVGALGCGGGFHGNRRSTTVIIPWRLITLPVMTSVVARGHATPVGYIITYVGLCIRVSAVEAVAYTAL